MNHTIRDALKEPCYRGRCRHYWIIETPIGRTSQGICKLCGITREFENYPVDSRYALEMPFPSTITRGKGNKHDDEETDRSREE